MTTFQNYLTSGHAWLFVPSAVVLGALHGMEPGHSKTMMAAFIISIRGTVRQAVLLGLSATASHTAIIWALAFVGLHYADRFKVEDTEAYFQLATGLSVVGMAAWMFWRIRRERNAPHVHQHHGDESRVFAMRHGEAELSIFEDGIPPCFRLRFRNAPLPAPERVTLVTTRPDGTTESFAFRQRESFLESTSAIPEPHEFSLTLVGVGTLAALSVMHATSRLKWLGPLTRRLPYASCALLVCVGLFITVQALRHLPH